MAGPSVNVVLRLDSSKVKEDAEKAKGFLTSAINPTVDVFNVAEKAAQAFGKALEFSGKALVFLTERTGAVQSLTSTLDDTRRALGEAADRSGALRTATEAIEKAARDLTGFLQTDEGRKAINDFFGLISTGAANALDSVTGLLRLIKDVSFEIDLFRSQFNSIKDTAAFDFVKKLANVPHIGAAAQAFVTVVGEEKVIASRSLAKGPLDVTTDLADRLRTAGNTSRPGSGVLESGTFRDEEAIKAAKAREEANAKALDAAMARVEGERKAGDALIKTLNDQAKAERDAAMRSLDSQRALAELTRTVEEGKTATARSNAELRAEIAEREQAAIAQQTEDMRAELDSQIGIASSIASAVSDTMTQIISAAATDVDLGAVVARIMGGYIASLGASAIAAGTLAVALGTLGLFVPAIGAAFPAAAIPLGFAAIGAGALAVGGGAYIQSLANGGGASGPSRGTAASGGGGSRSGGSVVVNRRTGFNGTPEGFAGASLAPVTTILNYNFNGPMGGSPRRIAREIRDLSTAGDTLLPGYRSPGGR